MNSRPVSAHAAAPHNAPSETPLHFRRLPLGDVASLASPMLGARLLAPTGMPVMPAGGAAVQAVRAELLMPAAPTLDAWLTPGTVTTHQHGCVHIATDGQWLHGSAELDPAATEGGLSHAAWRIYADLFAALAEHASPHLLRLWNYVPGINDHGDGLEHYRHFNIGRQRAFIEAGRSAFEGSPAACAVGTPGGPLQVFFLAGASAPLAIENPRQVSAYHYPAQYGPRSPTFSRAAWADVGGGRQALFISGTASIQGHASVHPGDVRMQTEETLLNIAAVLEAAQRQGHGTLRAEALSCTVYLRDREDLATVLDVLQQRFGADSHAVRTVVMLLADICRADLLVEIEAHGIVPAGIGR
jgi:enamine deaminase RidA (YjgF/YER057c/UK114 family)